MISVGFRRDFVFTAGLKSFLQTFGEGKTGGWERVGIAMRPLKNVFCTGKSTLLQKIP